MGATPLLALNMRKLRQIRKLRHSPPRVAPATCGHVHVWTPNGAATFSGVCGCMIGWGRSVALLVSVERFVTHRAMTRNRAERRAGRLQPFARGPDGVAA